MACIAYSQVWNGRTAIMIMKDGNEGGGGIYARFSTQSFNSSIVGILCLKTRKLETVYLKIITIDFDDIWQKYSK